MYLNCPTFLMVEVEGGSFMMGNEEGLEDEKPVHLVTLPNFEIGCFPVTNGLVSTVIEIGGWEIPPRFQGPPKHPAKSVSWDVAQLFLQCLNTIPEVKSWNNRDSRIFRLPSEAQWEYAARGGQRSKGFPFAGGFRLKEVGWIRENSFGDHKTVGMKLPNELGIYDMTGNILEWCEDHWHDSFLDAPRDGRAWIDAEENRKRVVRGAGIGASQNDCHIAVRLGVPSFVSSDTTGFRLARY